MLEINQLLYTLRPSKMTATRLQIQGFLAKLKQADTASITLARQEKTIRFMQLMELERDDVIAVLYTLAEEHYSEGPSRNDWNTGDVWVFGIHLDEKLIYVKLSVTSVQRRHAMLCMSFHPAERPMRFPYQNRK